MCLRRSQSERILYISRACWLEVEKNLGSSRAIYEVEEEDLTTTPNAYKNHQETQREKDLNLRCEYFNDNPTLFDFRPWHLLAHIRRTEEWSLHLGSSIVDISLD
nr:hypothetical protein CFP56_20462 [Quercus suber]